MRELYCVDRKSDDS